MGVLHRAELIADGGKQVGRLPGNEHGAALAHTQNLLGLLKQRCHLGHHIQIQHLHGLEHGLGIGSIEFLSHGLQIILGFYLTAEGRISQPGLGRGVGHRQLEEGKAFVTHVPGKTGNRCLRHRTGPCQFGNGQLDHLFLVCQNKVRQPLFRRGQGIIIAANFQNHTLLLLIHLPISC